MKLDQKGNTFILVVVFVALLAVAGLMLSNRVSEQPQLATPVLQNTEDLNKTAKDLDGVNVDSMDSELNELSRDAAAI